MQTQDASSAPARSAPRHASSGARDRARDRLSARLLSYARGQRSKRAEKARLQSVGGRKTAITKNAAAITTLTKTLQGDLQTQASMLADAQVVVSAKPLCFQLNNPGLGDYGPQLLRAAETHDHCDRLTKFVLEDRGPFYANEQHHVPNGPKLFIENVQLKFEFYGFVDSTRIRVDIVRQKKIDKQYWNPHDGTMNYMPNNLHGFEHLAGFTSREIDRSTFEVLQTKHLYLNSKASSNLADAAQDRPTSEATTSPYKLLTMNVPLKKTYTQLEATVNETTGVDDTQLDAHGEDGAESKGSYSYDNQDPFTNVWCIISTDDMTALGDVVTGDSVRVNIIRKVTWRDFRASGI